MSDYHPTHLRQPVGLPSVTRLTWSWGSTFTEEHQQTDVGNIWREIGVESRDGAIAVPADFELDKLTSNLSPVEVVTNLPPSEAIFRMAAAQTFIGAKSSMSFIAGFLRANRTTIFPKFWHPTPKSWIQV